MDALSAVLPPLSSRFVAFARCPRDLCQLLYLAMRRAGLAKQPDVWLMAAILSLIDQFVHSEKRAACEAGQPIKITTEQLQAKLCPWLEIHTVRRAVRLLCRLGVLEYVAGSRGIPSRACVRYDVLDRLTAELMPRDCVTEDTPMPEYIPSNSGTENTPIPPDRVTESYPIAANEVTESYPSLDHPELDTNTIDHGGRSDSKPDAAQSAESVDPRHSRADARRALLVESPNAPEQASPASGEEKKPAPAPMTPEEYEAWIHERHTRLGLPLQRTA